jgi:hypothetical protein
MSDESKDTIFSTILNNWLKGFTVNNSAFAALGDPMVVSCPACLVLYTLFFRYFFIFSLLTQNLLSEPRFILR